MPIRLAELGGEECLDEIPCDCRTDRPPTQAEDVEVIVLDPLLRGERVVNQSCADPWNLIDADRYADAAAADRQASFDLPGHYRFRERQAEVGIVIISVERGGAEIHHVVAGCA